ncbi:MULTISPECIES: class Ib ribonucleoside-diphosphate reductase assembly flavoprotein NrdI [Bacillus cereus group]|uniref:Ribonucleotide reductase n=3 Tax=Bacillus cereus group TaxID=86661 RepID=A0A0J1HXF1_BACAN|nr:MULTISPECIES: class Ib ribonucleoside-diphosphate reductase assembly flavoprotein NrdI [Bacillus cereus group]HDR7765475.1 class Ib ribonucleoside-diphosphate reductase assembly flavoprotein NrdI [Bacillus paranthracis]EOQ19707.1 nrdI protein [Bacillus cereus VD184]KLV18367.1 ribonucleotide reductase [Bacillus anthracis]MBF8118886.1 class Ib ribonucleoside-diphosphate reductase assembly flavoprotein NrdI [Bacillus cereus]OUB76952.1 ribonucleotide reductase assembly protein NrdI [Bacillus th
MLIIWESKTGNVSRFIEKLPKELKRNALRISQINNKIREKFVLITYTTGFGAIPEEVNSFLEKNYEYLLGVSASGNKNWGDNYAASADKIAAQYAVPILTKFELSGTKNNIIEFMNKINQLQL